MNIQWACWDTDAADQEIIRGSRPVEAQARGRADGSMGELKLQYATAGEYHVVVVVRRARPEGGPAATSASCHVNGVMSVGVSVHFLFALPIHFIETEFGRADTCMLVSSSDMGVFFCSARPPRDGHGGLEELVNWMERSGDAWAQPPLP